ncbi:MAG TPA: prefoldin subunit beta [Candidatus Thermoplasmatota archaeon]|nr:prefoldin subunit beta [Candidatus Thermoplasmatota archaeon]
MAADIPPQVQNQLMQLQQLRDQTQAVAVQRSQLEAAARELESTLGALSSTPADAAIYRASGSLLVEVKDRDVLKKGLEDEKETMEVRLQSAKKNEARLRERMTALQQELQAVLGGR